VYRILLCNILIKHNFLSLFSIITIVYLKTLLIEGRNIEIGNLFSFFDITFSVSALVKVYVFGQSTKTLYFHGICKLKNLEKIVIEKKDK